MSLKTQLFPSMDAITAEALVTEISQQQSYN
jgi:hypothetical protein